MIRWLLIVICLAGSAVAEETVFLKNGKFQKGTLVSQNEEELTFEFKRAGVSGVSRVRIPWKSVDRIEFESTVAQIDAMANPATTDIKVFVDLWEKHSPWISRPQSNAAKIGLAYATKLIESNGSEQALDLYQLISESAWHPEDQAVGVRGRLNTLLKIGKERDAIREAEELAEATENPALLLEAKQVLAANAFERLKAIEEENPRWELDDEIRPIRNGHFNTAIDHSLFAYLFFGSEETAAAKGLIFAAEVYQFADDSSNARLCCEDILKLYPETEVANQAKKLLSKIPSQSTE